ncbi:GIY-YIG catalytic domain-containing protein [Rheinheimera pacifica]|uniref:GIY-YIG catalytic domain-containing protein n=1 Tax=Rheinheimera pacifica TaxID=173990 RepID=A0A1H6NFT3_9GAMM|nr:GIY-YIG nuclease family protein [Rheinheimera pacifica]SEI14174.1 GIY-YIG catalytic domain-containing protein [Rheinheimera pacifica]
MYAIYGLVDPRNQKIFYVGRTSKPLKTRLNEHLCETDHTTLKQKRILEITSAIEDKILVIELEGGVSTEKEAFCREVFWIETMIKSGSPLTNASVDFGGFYFLREDTLENTPEISLKSAEPHYISASAHWDDDCVPEKDSAEVKLASMDGMFFKVENYIVQGHVLKQRNMTPETLHNKRIANIKAGRRLNHGMPIFDEEVREILRRFAKNSNISTLSIFFQRSEATMQKLIDEVLAE